MTKETNEKLLHLLSVIVPENMKHLVKEIANEEISPQQFRENCYMATLSPDKRDEYKRMKILDARYSNLTVYNFDMIHELYKKNYPEGMDFKVDGIGIQQIDDFIHKGHLLKEQSTISKVGDRTPSVDGMQCKFHFPVEKYQNLWVSGVVYEDENLADWLDYKGYPADYLTAPTIALNQHPDGNDVSMFFYEDELLRMLQVEGQPFWKAVAIKLQMPQIDQDMMVKYLQNPQQMQELMQMFEDAAQEEMKYHASNGTCPDSLNVVVGRHDIFMFEPFKIGYVQINKYRQMTAYGEPLTEENRERIADLLDNKHYMQMNEKAELDDFFIKEPKNGDKSSILMHRESAQCIYPHEMVNYDGIRYYNLGNDIHKAQNMNDYIDITDRITDVNLITQGSLRIRCKIDGEQHTARYLEYPERLIYSRGFDSLREEKDFLFRTAAKLFRDDLLSIGQEQSQGRKR